MTDRNENKPGYKKTKVGWIPEDWNYVCLSDVATIQTGFAKGKKNVINPISLPYLRVANVQDGFLDLEEIKKIQVGKKDVERFLLRNGDRLFTEGGDFDKLGRGTIWRDEISKCLHQNHVFAVRCDTNKLISYFLASIASSPHGRRYFLFSSKQSTNLASINTKQLKQFPIPLPSISEQKKIARILSTWDAAIEQTRMLIDAKKRLKKALMQQLLTGNIIPKGLHKDSWNIVPFGKLVFPVSRPLNKPEGTYLSIGLRSHCKGTFHRYIDKPEKIKMDTLYRVEPEDLVVNITFAWEGAIAFAKAEDSGGLVSHRFPTFRINAEKAVIEFVRNLVLTKRFIWELGLILPGGAGRNRVMNKKDFLKIKVYIPSIETQKKIGQILSSADNEINHLEKKLKALEKQKRGLMQKLLTGEVRVKVNNSSDNVKDES